MNVFKFIYNLASISSALFIILTTSLISSLSASAISAESEVIMTNPLKFSQLSTSDGLSNSNVFGVTQDKQGFIWLATEDGLNRYDGNNFVTYRHDAANKNSIADNVIRKLFIDRNNTLWVGTENGLSRYNRTLDNFDNFTSIENNEKTLKDNVIWDIYQDNKNILWVSTSTGLHSFSLPKRNEHTAKNIDTLNKNNYFQRVHIRDHEKNLKEVKTIFQDLNNNYWLGSFDNGIHILTRNINKELSYAGSLQGNNKLNLHINANALFDIKIIDRHYWLATDKGVFVIDDHYRLLSHFSKTAIKEANSETQQLLSNQIRAIEQLDDSHVWLASDKGLNSINLLDNTIKSYQHSNRETSLSENWLMDIYRDSNDNMWLATYGGGVNKYSVLAAKFKHSLQTKNNKSYRVQSFAETSDGIIWLSTEQKGLFQVKKNNIIKSIDIKLNENIWQIFKDDKDTLWLLTENKKLFNYKPRTNQVIEYKSWYKKSKYFPNKSILMIGSRLWYLNNENILCEYNTNTEEVIQYFSQNANDFINFSQNNINLLWLTTTNRELFEFDLNSKSLTKLKIKIPKDFDVKQINNIALSKNWVWIGSNAQGITLINKKNKVSYIFNESNGLKNNYISSILIDKKEKAWLSTNTGISSINPNTKYISHFDNDFAIKSPEFNKYAALKLKNTEMLFGSPNGFYQFSPNDTYLIKQVITKPIFTHLYVANKKINIRNEIQKKNTKVDSKSEYTIDKQLNALEQVELKHHQSPISFEFISPNVKLPTQLRYKYRLVGLEKDWIEADINNNRATYTNLNSGDYIFEVQAYDIYTPDNNKTSQLNVHIMPPWWLSTIAMLAYLVLFLLIVSYFIQQYRQRRLAHLQIKSSEERLKLSLWGSGDEMWDWDIATDKMFRTNIWGILDFPQDGTRNDVSSDNNTEDMHERGLAKSNIHQHDLARVKQALDDHFDEKTAHFEATYRVLNKYNEWVWILDRGKIVERDAKNSPLRMTGTLKDISHIKVAEERLKLFAKCIENISDAVVIYDKKFTTVEINQAFERITSETRQQAIGRVLTFSQYPSSFTSNLKKHLITKGNWQGEIESVREDGSKYYSELSIDVIRDESNSISHFVGVFSDITKRKETESELRKLASSDTLTGLPNRTFFQANQTRLVRNKIPYALLVFDLDNFKRINDSLGHQMGDLLLCKVAERMTKVGRNQDTIYRLGGDEFSLIIENTNDIHTITTLAKNILKSIVQPFRLKNQEVVLTSSIGIVLYPEDGNSPHELLRNADTAMYHAKGLGGNKYQFFNDSMNKQAVKRLQIESMIRHGLKNDSFSVYYQPKIAVATGKVSGMEALVRFETPDNGLISPIVFIPVSEETGQIIDIGEIVLRKACFATKKWVDEGLFDGRVAVNLSAVQFTQPNLVELIASILKESKLSAKYLELEITEGTVMDSPTQAIETMEQIRAMGVHLSLDDFGTGYSSLAYLKKFPLNTLKIDKAFVDDIEVSEQGRNMVATIVTIAHNLGMDVVAEGVESKPQLDFLSKIHCEQLQGYLYSKPLETKQFKKYLLAHQIASKSTSFNKR